MILRHKHKEPRNRCRALALILCPIAILPIVISLHPNLLSIKARFSSKLEVDAATKNTFSSFYCVGGSQTFPGTLQHTWEEFPVANHSRYRVCLFHDVCVVNGEVVYFSRQENLGPEFFEIESFEEGMVGLAYIGPFGWRPKVVYSTLPSIAYTRKEVVFGDALSISFNMGHLLIDNIFPQFIAMELFNLNVKSFEFFIMNEASHSYWDEPSEDFQNKTRRDDAIQNYDIIVPLFFSTLPRWLHNTTDFCMKRFIVGQSSAFSVRSLDYGRPIHFRRIRDHLRKQLKIQVPASKNLIFVCQKTYRSVWNDLCDAVKHVIGQSYEILCSTKCMYAAAFAENVARIQRAWLVITEHGTVSYLSLFADDDTKVIVIGYQFFKEVQNLLFATHVRYYFISGHVQGDLARAYKYLEHFHEKKRVH